MKDYFLFDDFHQWLTCLMTGIKKFLWGLVRIFTCLIGAVLSLLRALWRKMVRFVGMYPNIALGGGLVLMAIVWVLTFAPMRAKTVGSEHQRDSLFYELSKYTELFGGKDSTYMEKVVVGTDTFDYNPK